MPNCAADRKTLAAGRGRDVRLPPAGDCLIRGHGTRIGLAPRSGNGGLLGVDTVLLGGPSLTRTWLETVLRAAANAAAPRATIVEVDFSSSPIADIGSPQHGAPRLMLVKEPASWLLAAIEAGRVGTIAALEDPLDAVAYVRSQKSCTLLEGVRAQSAAAAGARVIRQNPSVTFISRDIGMPARRVASELLRLTGWAFEGNKAELMSSRFAGGPDEVRSLDGILSSLAHYRPPLRQTSDLAGDAQARAVCSALDPLLALAQGGPLPMIAWSLDLLLDGDDFVRPAPPVVELTGPARNLVRGPYLCLPPGRYGCRYEMGFSRYGAETRYSLEIHGKHLIAKHGFVPRKAGHYALDFEIEIDTPDHWIDMRLRLEEGTIEGRAAAVGVQLRMLD